MNHEGHIQLNNQQVDQQVARRLTRFYILALAFIALLALSGIVLVRYTLRDHYNDGRVLNIAGRQRMFSQRLTKLILLRTQHIPSADSASIDTLLQTWATSQQQLRAGMLRMEKAYPVSKSPVLETMFTQIEPVFERMYGGLKQVLDTTRSSVQQAEALRVVLADEPTYLKQMNAIVFQFDAESSTRVKTLEQVETILGLATMVIVLLEGLFIFRPVVAYTRALIRQQRSEDTVRAAALLEGQEDERRRFARELHDGIGQMLTGLKLQAETLKKASFEDEKHRRRAENLCVLIGDIIQTTRQISHNLMPSVLSDFGLAAALQLLTDQTAYSTGLTIQLELTPDSAATPPPRLSPAIEIGLYRLAQEALNNAVKHAQANHIWLHLQQDEQAVALTVSDDGIGFATSIFSNLVPRKTSDLLVGHHGIATMHTRARLLNGTLSIRSAPQEGTTIFAYIHLIKN